MRCNACWKEQAPKTQCVATACGHLFCVTCAEQIIGSADSSCPVCDRVLTKGVVRVVNIHQDKSACSLTMCGQTPETAIASALTAVNFHSVQQQLIAAKREEQLQRKNQRLQEQCKAKLQEVHNGYLQARAKYQQLLQAKNKLEADHQELTQKYTQKAQQARKLQEMFEKQHGMGRGLAHQHGRSPLQQQVVQDQHVDFLDGDARVRTTVHRKQAFYTRAPSMSPSMLSGNENGGPASGDGMLEMHDRRGRRTPTLSPVPSLQTGGNMMAAPGHMGRRQPAGNSMFDEYGVDPSADFGPRGQPRQRITGTISGLASL